MAQALVPILFVYLALGACAILGNFLYLKFFECPQDSPLSSAPRLAARPSLRNRMSDALGFVFAFIVAVAIWPFLIIPEIKGRMNRRRFETGLPDAPKFLANKDNLLERVDCADIERKETVSDPLGAAPNVPFGHLNTVWQAFKGRIADGDEVWLFSTLGRSSLTAPAARWTRIAEGYAVLRGGTIIDEFVAHGGLLEVARLPAASERP